MTTEESNCFQDSVYLGYVKKVHGVKGRIVARIFTVRNQSEIPHGTELTFGESRIENVLESSIKDTETVFLSLSNIESAEKADEVRGKPIRMSRESILGMPDFFPTYLFVDMVLQSRDEELPVVDVFPDSVNPLLLLKGTDGVFPIPFAMVFEQGEIDLEKGRIYLSIPDGMEQNTGDWS